MINNKDFFKGDVYKATWITDSIKAGILLDKDDFFWKHFSDMEHKGNKKFELPNKCLYTLTEAFKINELSLKNKDRSKGATFWKEIEFKGLSP